MALFTCKLGSTDGRIIEKEFEAANDIVLRQSLEEQGFYVFEVRRNMFQFLRDKGFIRHKVDNKELLTFNQELLVLIKAGLPIIHALDTILERVEKGRLSEVLNEVREDVKGGISLSQAFEKHPREFAHLYIASIRAGERTGDIHQTIKRYISYLKRVEAFRKKVISALIYPIILTTVAILAVTLLLVYVVPTFSQVYADARSSLPVPTQVLIYFTVKLKKFLPIVLIAIICLFFAFNRWRETIRGRFLLDDLKLRLPYLGGLLTKYAIAAFTRTLATVIGSGIPIVESLRMSVGTLNNRVLEQKLLEAVVKVEEGIRLSAALESVNIMPPLALRMLAVGETTGSLEEMLADIADYFEDEVDRSMHIVTTAIEPIIMIVMGIVIGAIIITMYLPIFKIAGTVG
jgi:type IV pilus assembly protein PilC